MPIAHPLSCLPCCLMPLTLVCLPCALLLQLLDALCPLASHLQRVSLHNVELKPEFIEAMGRALGPVIHTPRLSMETFPLDGWKNEGW